LILVVCLNVPSKGTPRGWGSPGPSNKDQEVQLLKSDTSLKIIAGLINHSC
jgi:hypothetical protein